MDTGKITAQFLKSISGEFDLEVIFKADLTDYGINDLGSIGACVNIEWLDLSSNELSRLYGLASLSKVSNLNLASNKIESLEGLQTLDSLEILNLSGNNIHSIDELSWLAGLENLKSLRLWDKTNNLSNPICNSPTYELDVTDMLPDIIELDGWRIKGPGSDLSEICYDLDQRIKSLKSIQAVKVPQFEMGDFWQKDDGFQELSRADDAEEQLKLLLEECRALLENKAM